MFGKRYNPVLQEYFKQVKTQFDIAERAIKEGEDLTKRESRSGYVDERFGSNVRVSTTTARMATNLRNEALNTLAKNLENIAKQMKR